MKKVFTNTTTMLSGLAITICSMPSIAYAQDHPRSQAASSSYLASGWESNYAIDGMYGSVWSSQLHWSPGSYEWFAFWFDGFRDTDYIRIVPRNWNGQSIDVPESVHIYYSANGTWNYITTVLLPANLPVSGYRISFSNVYANGILLTTEQLRPDPYGGYYFQIAEIYGGKSSTASVDPATTLLFDTFTAGDGTTLTSHAPDVALAQGTWTVSGPGWYAPHATIIGQWLTQDDPEGSGGDYRQATINAGTADGVVGVDWFPAASSAYTPASGLVFRKVDARNFWYVGSWAGSPISVWRVVDAYWGDPVTVATAIDQRHPHRLEAALNGPSITVRVDGAAIAQLTDAFAATGHLYGLHWWTGYDVGSAFDNFSVDGSLSCVTALSSAPISAAGGSGGLTVAAPSGCGWTAVTDASWLTLTAPSGQGNGTVGFSAATNPGWMARTATVYINGRTSTVTQVGATPTDFSCEPSISPPSAAIDSNGKTDVFSVVVPDGCYWRVESTTAGWMQPEFVGTQQSRTVEYTVDANASGVARGGAIYVRDLTYGVLRRFGVDQAAGGNGGGGAPSSCGYTVSPFYLLMGSGGGMSQ